MSAGLAVCAPTLVDALLPATWSQVAPLLSVLAIASLPGSGSFILSAFLAAHARNHRLMWIEVATMASLIVALWLLSKGGVLLASAAIGVAALVQWVLTVQACRIDGLRLQGLGRALSRIALAGTVMVLAVLAWRWTLGASMDAAWRLLTEVLVGVVVYGVGLWGFARGLVGDALAGIGMSRLRIPGLRTRQGEGTS